MDVPRIGWTRPEWTRPAGATSA